MKREGDPATARTRQELREQIGRLLVVGIPGTCLDAATRHALEELRVGGVILLRHNVATPDELSALTAELHALPSHPLVTIDHEGGRVMRLGEPFTQFPPAAVIGSHGDAGLAQQIGRAMAEELATVGIDVDFAPVLDVHSNPRNPVIGDRAFGCDTDLVRAIGVAMMRGLLAGGVIPCGKHFPGHGDTDADSHTELPVVRRSREELERTELVPFRAAIAAGMPMLMTAHVLYPDLDPDSPATLSRTILSGLLRGELGFDGVIATDDLEMGAIAADRPISDAAVAALDAGADWLLVCQDLGQAARAFAAIERASANGSLHPGRIAAASNRVRRLRASHAAVRAGGCKLPNAAHRALLGALGGAGHNGKA